MARPADDHTEQPAADPLAVTFTTDDAPLEQVLAGILSVPEA